MPSVSLEFCSCFLFAVQLLMITLCTSLLIAHAVKRRVEVGVGYGGGGGWWWLVRVWPSGQSSVLACW
jgi:hypothetical protein